MNRRIYILAGAVLIAGVACSGSQNHALFDPSKVKKIGEQTNKDTSTTQPTQAQPPASGTTPSGRVWTWDDGMETCYDKDRVYLGDKAPPECQEFFTQVVGYVESTKRTVRWSDLVGLTMGSDFSLPAGNGYMYPNGYGAYAPSQGGYGPFGSNMNSFSRARLSIGLYGQYGRTQSGGGMVPFRSPLYQNYQNYLTPRYCGGRVRTGSCPQGVNYQQFFMHRCPMAAVDDTIRAVPRETREQIVYRLEEIEPQIRTIGEREPGVRNAYGSVVDTLRGMKDSEWDQFKREVGGSLTGAAYNLAGAAQYVLPRLGSSIMSNVTLPIRSLSAMSRGFLGLGQRLNMGGYAPEGFCDQPESEYDVRTIEYRRCVCETTVIQEVCY
ncbi:MAG: hypothetical protein V1798_10850 [Pseudomonadota bacterium]